MKSPHILLASNNPYKLTKNLKGIISDDSLLNLEFEIKKNVAELFQLGNSHYLFSLSIKKNHWRQKVSRLYYGAYNVRRSINLLHDGSYNTNSDDHKNIKLPTDFPSHAMYSQRIKDLREDRNLADYNHSANESDLLLEIKQAEKVISEFLDYARNYLIKAGVTL